MTFQPESTATILELSQGWTVTNGKHSVALAVPGDVHSALLEAGIISDPYWRDTEVSLDWVHQSEWTATRCFDFADNGGFWTLAFDGIDCVAEIRLNGHMLGRVDNRFLRQDFEVGEKAADRRKPPGGPLPVQFRRGLRPGRHFALSGSLYEGQQPDPAL